VLRIPFMLTLTLILMAARPASALEFRFVAGESGPDGAPSFSPDGQEISFSSAMSGDWEIWRVGAWGEDLGNFTDNPGIDIYANWSPAGPWIVFSSRRDNGHGNEDRDLWLAHTELDSLRCLTTWTGDDNYGAIDPSGTQVAFTSDRGGELELWLMPLDGGSPPVRLSYGLLDCFHACWSPDGQWIAFDGREPGSFSRQLYRVPSAGGPVEEIPTGLVHNSDPGWSPDGRYLAFAGNDDLIEWDLWAWDFQESVLVRITDTRFSEQSPMWNAAGTEIVYARVHDDNKDIWVVSDLPFGTATQKRSLSSIKSLFR
jgi:Tol biopolymer transport system component